MTKHHAVFASVVLCMLVTANSYAQRAGQSITVQYGLVTGGQQVDLKSAAVPAGAVIGGSLGLASAKGKKSSKKVRNSLIGAAAGGLVAKSAQGDTRGMVYQVTLNASAGAVQVVTDQREIQVGDCVAVERAGETANLRRVGSAYCEANTEVVATVADESEEEAEECLMAKQALVAASTVDEADLAVMKMRLLCDS